MLKQFIRIGKKGQPVYDDLGIKFVQQTRGPKIGVLVALDKDRIGWSLISEKEHFDEIVTETYVVTTPKGVKNVTKEKPVWNAERIWEFGTRLAVERAKGEQPIPQIVPRLVEKEVKQFKKRVNAYFK